MVNHISEDIHKVARVIRSARKALGKNQREIATKVNLTQSTISKVESCQTVLSMVEWYQLCDALQIESENVFRNGYIDQCSPMFLKSQTLDNPYKLPKKYTKYQGSKVRIINPILGFFEKKLGAHLLDEYLNSVKVDPDFFVIYDNQVNVRFSLDMIAALISKGALKKENVQDISYFAGFSHFHGKLYESYKSIKSRKELLKKMIHNSALYEINSTYSIKDESDDSLVMKVKLAPHMKFFDYTNELLGNFFCEYKKNYFLDFLKLIPGHSVHLHERECLFKGSKQCIYDFKFGKL